MKPQSKTTLIYHSSPSMGYDVTPLETCLIYANSVGLSKKTFIWPHPEDLFLGGSKLHVYKTLRDVCHSMKISTPMYVTAVESVQDSTFLNDFANGKVQGVLKREYSMKAQHVVRPTDPNPSSKIKKLLLEEDNTWKRVQDMFGLPKWFLQPFVPHLLFVGEVRCFIVSGKLVYKVTTTPGSGPFLEVTSYDHIRPLHTHR